MHHCRLLVQYIFRFSLCWRISPKEALPFGQYWGIYWVRKALFSFTLFSYYQGEGTSQDKSDTCRNFDILIFKKLMFRTLIIFFFFFIFLIFIFLSFKSLRKQTYKGQHSYLQEFGGWSTYPLQFSICPLFPYLAKTMWVYRNISVYITTCDNFSICIVCIQLETFSMESSVIFY